MQRRYVAELWAPCANERAYEVRSTRRFRTLAACQHWASRKLAPHAEYVTRDAPWSRGWCVEVRDRKVKARTAHGGMVIMALFPPTHIVPSVGELGVTP